jgi:hypothetical protein
MTYTQPRGARPGMYIENLPVCPTSCPDIGNPDGNPDHGDGICIVDGQR